MPETLVDLEAAYGNLGAYTPLGSTLAYKPGRVVPVTVQHTAVAYASGTQVGRLIHMKNVLPRQLASLGALKVTGVTWVLSNPLPVALGLILFKDSITDVGDVVALTLSDADWFKACYAQVVQNSSWNSIPGTSPLQSIAVVDEEHRVSPVGRDLYGLIVNIGDAWTPTQAASLIINIGLEAA